MTLAVKSGVKPQYNQPTNKSVFAAEFEEPKIGISGKWLIIRWRNF